MIWVVVAMLLDTQQFTGDLIPLSCDDERLVCSRLVRIYEPVVVSPPGGTLPSNPTILVAARVARGLRVVRGKHDVPFVARRVDDVLRLDIEMERGEIEVRNAEGTVLAQFLVGPYPVRHETKVGASWVGRRMQLTLPRNEAIGFRIIRADGLPRVALPSPADDAGYQEVDLVRYAGATTELMPRSVLRTGVEFELVALYADGEQRVLGPFKTAPRPDEDGADSYPEPPRSTPHAPPRLGWFVAIALMMASRALFASHRRRQQALDPDPMPAARVVRR